MFLQMNPFLVLALPALAIVGGWICGCDLLDHVDWVWSIDDRLAMLFRSDFLARHTIIGLGLFMIVCYKNLTGWKFLNLVCRQ